ncbi:DUF6370 family protein [Flaviaesturariibacter amylovorans]|uniref:DUF6370 family protein n=1 Tax=Flaviaesturariibacter amylovorans TaxID=1084520 RepID=A0ABP8G9E8_9BACT
MTRVFLLSLGLCLSAAAAHAQQKSEAKTAAAKVQVVEASCGKCKFGMTGDECELAVRIDGKAYLVDGSKIDNHGDAHAADGFCNAIRKAEVTGSIIDGRYKAASFKLLPPATPARKN